MSVRFTFHNNRLMQDRRRVRVSLPDGEDLSLIIGVRATAKQLFTQVCDLLHIKDGQLFGLCVHTKKERVFMNPQEKLTKYCPKEWKKEASKGIDHFGPPFHVHFEVQYFVENGKLIGDKVGRYFYHWQLRRRVLASQCGHREEAYFLLAACALQADLGPFRSECHHGVYFRPQDYFPHWVIKKRGHDYITQHVPGMHQELAEMSAATARLRYIRQAAQLEDVPVHYFLLYKEKKDFEATLILALTLKGIQIFQKSGEERQLIYDFPWFNVGKLIFLGKKFELEPDGLPSARRLTAYTGSTCRSRSLLHLLSSSHRLHMACQPLLQKLRHAEHAELGSSLCSHRSSGTSGIELDTRHKRGKALTTLKLEMAEASVSSGVGGHRGLQQCSSLASGGSSYTSGVESGGREKLDEDSPDDEVEMMVDDPLEFPHLVETDVEDDSTVADAPYIYVTQKDLDSRCTSPEGLVVKMMDCHKPHPPLLFARGGSVRVFPTSGLLEAQLRRSSLRNLRPAMAPPKPPSGSVHLSLLNDDSLPEFVV
uniref:FERM domain-containing protein 6 isoform X2 n=1 Tax=Myxine glutinosa TaxID=7769 RepID=UPI00358E4923